MRGLELAVRFSYITNCLRYCGPAEASKEFMRYLKNRDNAKAVKSLLKRFEALMPYLSAIAERNEKDPKEIFDYDVVEAYWIGNKLLEGFEKKDIERIIEGLVRRGLPSSVGKQLIERLPHGFVPHHNFNVMYVGVGQVTGSVKTTLHNMDECRISWGKVARVSKNVILVRTKPLNRKSNKFFLDEEKEKKVSFIPEMIKPAKGDTVAIHWSFAPLRLSKKQARALEEYTERIIDVMNNIKKRQDYKAMPFNNI